jgi:glycosyltransferase involved in cell wall biosynthesis
MNITVHTIQSPSLKTIINLSPLRAVFRLIQLFKTYHIDIIHLNGSRVCLYGAIAGRFLGKKTIWHVRESINDISLYDRLLATLVDTIICVSESVRLKRFKKFGRKINEKIVIVYNGVDTAVFKKCLRNRKQFRDQFLLNSDDIFIGLIGNIIPRKAQDFFLKGLGIAKTIQPDLRVKVLLIGHYLDKAYANYLKKLISKLNLDSDVMLNEFTNKIPNVLSALDIYVLSSQSEGFCRSLLEAMSCELPIIATKISEIEEAITDHKNGYLVDFMDTDSMADVIVKLCRDQSMRSNIGTLNRLTAVKKYSLVEHTNKIQSIYYKTIYQNCKNLCLKN